jgi:outer membrane protein OmpA-like peptidoglycan-associated protein
MVVDVAPFDAATAVAKTPEQPKGCASIESTSNQDAIASSTKDSTQHVITERFVFEDGSSALPADAATQADAVAARLKQTPELQCVGVVGQWVRGENAAVAFARARAVRELLIERGVEPERLVALTVDAPMVGLTGTPEPPKAEDRRVSISVLLDVTRTAP